MSKKIIHHTGHWLGMGIGIGAMFGAVLGWVLTYIANSAGMLPLGFASGVAMGLIVGLVLENKYNKKAKPLKSRAQRLLLAIVIFGGILILTCFLSLFIIANR